MKPLKKRLQRLYGLGNDPTDELPKHESKAKSQKETAH
jgi:hypothetical protein